MRKVEIENASIAGLKIDGRDIVIVKRGSGGRVLHLRHYWRDNADGRILSAVSAAWFRYAEDLATKIGHHVEVYTRDGHMLDQVFPRERS